MKLLFTFLAVISALHVHGTHISGGQISYEHMGGNDYRVELVMYFNPASPDDRDSVNVRIYRAADRSVLKDFMANLVSMESLSPHFQKNTYAKEFSLPEEGQYILASSDLYRTFGIRNMTGSETNSFYIEAFLDHSLTNPVNSPQFLTGPILYLPVNDTIYHSIVVESLEENCISFQLTDPKKAAQMPVVGYGDINTTIDMVSGMMRFYSPDTGLHTFAVTVYEWENKMVRSSAQRDFTVMFIQEEHAMEFIIPPFQKREEAIFEIFTTEGDTIDFTIVFKDSLSAIPPMLQAYGSAFSHVNPPLYATRTGINEIEGDFFWVIREEHQRNTPFIFTFRGISNIEFPPGANIDLEQTVTVLVYTTDSPEDCYRIVGVSENKRDNRKLLVYPNPFEKFTLIENLNETVNHVYLLDLYGRSVRVLETMNRQSVLLHREDLPSGVYFLKAIDKKGNVFVEKLIIQ